jgi:hypothetical protein
MSTLTFLEFQVRTAVIGNYKHDRLFGRGDEYGNTVIASALDDVKSNGKFSIGRHESKSGEPIDFTLDGASLILMECAK